MARLIDADEFVKELYSEFHGMISDESLKIYQIIQRIAETVKFTAADNKPQKNVDFSTNLHTHTA